MKKATYQKMKNLKNEKNSKKHLTLYQRFDILERYFERGVFFKKEKNIFEKSRKKVLTFQFKNDILVMRLRKQANDL